MAKRNRHERVESRLTRRPGKKAPRQRVLIACEGEKTEVLYFEGIRRKYRASATTIKVVQRPRTEPIQVVDFALATFRADNAYDAVYAVFDRDEHRTYAEALRQAAANDDQYLNDFKKRVPFKAVPSVPSFELWFLLHFRDVFEPMHRDDVFAALERAYPDYAKNRPTVFQDLEERLEAARRRAVSLREDRGHTAEDGEAPFTLADVVTAAVIEAGAGT